MLTILPPIAYVILTLFILWIALTGRWQSLSWLIPAIVGAAFLAFTLVTVGQEGLIGFWTNHTSNLSGNQVWFDLLLAVGISFYLIAPRAKAVGMPLVPWAIAVLATASVALLPMLARMLWLEHRSRHS